MKPTITITTKNGKTIRALDRPPRLIWPPHLDEDHIEREWKKVREEKT